MMKLLALAATAAGLSIAGAASAATVFFEDFSGYSPTTIPHGAHAATSTSGNSLTTDYSYRVPGNGNTMADADSMYDESAWTIAANPFSVHNLWVDLGAGATNPMLMLNGMVGASSADPAASYTSGAFAVSAGTYNFSYDLMNLCCNANGPPGTQSFLRFWYSANGEPFHFVPGTDIAPATAGVFANQSGSFHLDSGGLLRVGLVDSQGASSGNDFGIDNIRISSVPEPMSWALMILGLGGIGATLRRRQTTFA